MNIGNEYRSLVNEVVPPN